MKSDCQVSLGIRGFEADVGGLGSFLRLGGDQAGFGQVAADRGAGDLVSVVVFEVPGDGLGSGVQAGGGQVGAESEDQLDHGDVQGARGGLGSTRSGFEGRLALGVVAGDEFGDPAFGDAVGRGDLGLGSALDDNSSDDQPGFRHGRASNPRPGFPMS